MANRMIQGSLLAVLGVVVVFLALRAREVPLAGQALAEPAGIGAVSEKENAAARLTRLPAAFIENRGQWDPETRFIARRGGATLRVERDAIGLAVPGGSVRIAFEGTEPSSEAVGLDREAGYYNFYIGNDPFRWRDHVPGYAVARLSGLYPGVDLVAREEDGTFEYDLMLAPGVDLDRVTAVCQGVESIGISPEGKLTMATAFGEITQGIPATWEILPDGTRRPVLCAYRLLGEKRFGFSIPRRDPALACVIDPPLEFSTLLGGNGGEFVAGTGLLASGGIVVAGDTDSLDFPRTPGAFDREGDPYEGDGFVTVLAPGGAHLVYSTFIGGVELEFLNAVAVDAAGSIAVAGQTWGDDFPVAGLAPFPRKGGAADAFVSRFTSAGVLAYSTFLGGAANQSGNAVAFGAGGTLVVGGSDANGPNFPGLSYRSPNLGGNDVFVAMLSEARAEPVFIAAFGGSRWDSCSDLAIEEETGVILIGGETESVDMEVLDAFDGTFNGNVDAFVAGLRPDGTGLVFSTYLGGRDVDRLDSVLSGARGEWVATGTTWSAQEPDPFPVLDPIQPAWGSGDLFVSHFRDYRTMVFSTFLGGTGAESVQDAAFLRGAGSERLLFLAGWTTSTAAAFFPVTGDAFDMTHNGGSDAFLMRIGLDAPRRVLHATYLGGIESDTGRAIAVDGVGRCVMAGYAGSFEFPTTPGAVDREVNGRNDAFVCSLDVPTTLSCEISPLFDVQDVRRNQTVSFDVVVRNNTSNTTSDAVIELYGFRETPAWARPYGGGSPFATVTALGLAPGETRAIRRSYAIPPNTPPGIYTIRARLALGASHDAFAFSFRVRE